MNNLTLLERETIINYNQAEAAANVFASDPALMRRLDKLCEEQPESVKLLRRGDDWAEYEVPKKWVKINPPPKRAPLTLEQKAAACERLKLAHEKRKLVHEKHLRKG